MRIPMSTSPAPNVWGGVAQVRQTPSCKFTLDRPRSLLPGAQSHSHSSLTVKKRRMFWVHRVDMVIIHLNLSHPIIDSDHMCVIRSRTTRTMV